LHEDMDQHLFFTDFAFRCGMFRVDERDEAEVPEVWRLFFDEGRSRRISQDVAPSPLRICLPGLQPLYPGVISQREDASRSIISLFSSFRRQTFGIASTPR